MMNYSAVEYISNYRGQFANEYDTHLEYVESGAWEKDYFSAWLEGCSDYPSLCELMVFCKEVSYDIRHWLDGVNSGKIDPEAGIED